MPTWADLYGGEYPLIPEDDYPEAYLNNGPIYPDQITKNVDSIFGKVVDGKLIEPLKQPKNQPQRILTSEQEVKEKLELSANEDRPTKNQNIVSVNKRPSKTRRNLTFGANRNYKNNNEI